MKLPTSFPSSNPYSRLWGWIYVGRWIPSRIALEVFLEAYRLRSRRFRFACTATMLTAGCTSLVCMFMAIDLPGVGVKRAVFVNLVCILSMGLVYQLVMRRLINKELNIVWRGRGERICIYCGYSRVGLARDAVCPECGAAPEVE
jgi:hypothetical protein